MRIATLMAGATLVLGMMAAAAPSQADPRLPHVSGAGNFVVQAHDDDEDHHGRGRWWREHHEHEHERDSCREVRHECADHFEWGTWRFERCVRRHGC
jgi:Spy/CpxP family protein refolding chaperone